MNTTQEKIIAKIQELVPEIMELKEGCIFEYKDNDIYTYQSGHKLKIVSKLQGGHITPHNETHWDGFSFISMEDEYRCPDEKLDIIGGFDGNQSYLDDIEILGRPITKFDVERAIDKYGKSILSKVEGTNPAITINDKLTECYHFTPAYEHLENNLQIQLENNAELSEFLSEIFNLNKDV